MSSFWETPQFVPSTSTGAMNDWTSQTLTILKNRRCYVHYAEPCVFVFCLRQFCTSNTCTRRTYLCRVNNGRQKKFEKLLTYNEKLPLAILVGFDQESVLRNGKL